MEKVSTHNVGDLKTVAAGKKLPLQFCEQLGAGRFEAVEAGVAFAVPFCFERPGDAVLRGAIAINGDVKFIGESEQSGKCGRCVRG